MKTLPEHPNLDHLRRQAKDLLGRLRTETASATLAEAQASLAGQYGFASWTALAAEVERRRTNGGVADPELGERLSLAFGLGAPTGPMRPVERGAMGMVWRLDTDQGAFAVKQLFEWARHDRVDIEARVVDAAVAAGVETPSIVRAPDGAVVVWLDGVRWRAFAWATMGPTLGKPVSAEHARAIGEALARLHGLDLAADAAEVIPWFTQRATEEQWRAGAARVAAAAPPWADLVAKALPDLIALAATAEPAASMAPCILSHCDLTLGNVRSCGAGRGLVLLDWEHAGAIPPLWELGYVLNQWALGPGDAVHDGVARAIVRGYRDAGGAADRLGLGIFAGAISAQLNWTGGQIRQALTADDPAQREHSAAEVVNLLSHPLTPQRLQRVLEAADS